jgi:translation factor GUF1, mitochondrial
MWRGALRRFSTVRYRAQDNALDLSLFEPPIIRNFCIVSHVDHGKSTLTQRMLNATGAVALEKGLSSRFSFVVLIALVFEGAQTLFTDQLEVERERGITVHASSASLVWKNHLLNLIDTPGHIDFQYEVSRALKACEGAVLLVDATKGVQAQTISNFWLAFEANLTIVPVINKIDLDHADVANVLAQLKSMFEIDSSDVLLTSAKSGLNVEQVMDAVIARVPPPPSSGRGARLQALLFDSWYDRHVGVVMLWRLMSGRVAVGDRIRSLHSRTEYVVQDVGMLFPRPSKGTELNVGQVGYVTCAMKSAPEAFAGDTFVLSGDVETKALPGFKGPRSVVFAGLFAIDSSDSALLADAMEKILLTDNSVVARKESSLALGTGFRCGFLGVLHMEVFIQRLLQEHGLEVIATAPTVPYQVKKRKKKEEERLRERLRLRERK